MENTVKNIDPKDKFRYFKEKALFLNQPAAAKLWFERVEQNNKKISDYFELALREDPKYQQLSKIKRGKILKSSKIIYSFFTELTEKTNNENIFSVNDINDLIDETVPVEQENNYNTFDELWDAVENTELAIELLDKAEDDLNLEVEECNFYDEFKFRQSGLSSVNHESNAPPNWIIDMAKEVKDGKALPNPTRLGYARYKRQIRNEKKLQKNNEDNIFNIQKKEPILEYSRIHNRILITDYSTEEINKKEVVNLIEELALIFDKLTLLENKNKFANSKEKLNQKLRGYEIFNELKKMGINISLKKVIKDWSFQTIPTFIHKSFYIKTTIKLDTVLNIVYGNKSEFVPYITKSYRNIINLQARSIRRLIDDHMNSKTTG